MVVRCLSLNCGLCDIDRTSWENRIDPQHYDEETKKDIRNFLGRKREPL